MFMRRYNKKQQTLLEKVNLSPLEKKIRTKTIVGVHTEEEILRKYIRVWNRLRIKDIGSYLASDFKYGSFWVLTSLNRAGFLRYLDGKFKAIRRTHSSVKASLVPNRNMILLNQGGNRAVLCVTIHDGLIHEIYMMPPQMYNL